MPKAISRDQLLELLETGAQLVEVLPRHEYDEEHPPDANHLPLKSLNSETATTLGRGRPVIVYRWAGL